MVNICALLSDDFLNYRTENIKTLKIGAIYLIKLLTNVPMMFKLQKI